MLSRRQVARIEADSRAHRDEFGDLPRAAPDIVLDLHPHVDHTIGAQLRRLLTHARNRQPTRRAQRVAEALNFGGSDSPIVLVAGFEDAGADHQAVRKIANARQRQELGHRELAESRRGALLVAHSPSTAATPSSRADSAKNGLAKSPATPVGTTAVPITNSSINSPLIKAELPAFHGVVE